MKFITLPSLLVYAFATAIASTSTSTSNIDPGKKVVSKGSDAASVGLHPMSEPSHSEVTNVPNHPDPFTRRLWRKVEEFNQRYKQSVEKAQ
jgi:hypothetical protein